MNITESIIEINRKYPDMTADVMAARFGTNLVYVHAIARRHGLIIPGRAAQMTNWTPEKVSRLVKMWNAGESARHICKELNLSRSAVIGKVCRLRESTDLIVREGGPFKYDARTKAYGSDAYSASRAENIKKARAAIQHMVINGVRLVITPPWPEDRVRQLMEAWNADMDLRDIATSMDRTVKSIDNKVRQLISVGLLKPRAFKPRRIVEKPHTVASLRVLEERKTAFQDFGQSALTRMESAEPGTGKPIEELKFKQCRWPTGGSQPQWLFCGNEIEIDVKSSYCAACRPRALAGYTWRNEPKAERVAA